MRHEKRYVLSLGKVNYGNPSGRRVNAVELELAIRLLDGPARTVDLEDVDSRVELSVCGGIWNGRGTDYVACGQMIDEIARLFSRDERVRRIAAIWKRWHLNAMKPGTRLQQMALSAYWNVRVGRSLDHYGESCAYLKSVGLYVDQGYAYGHAWLYEPIPVEVLAEVRALFGVDEEEQKAAA